MISRVAEHCFWMSRYLERAENTARILEVNQTLLLDFDVPVEQQWKPLLIISGIHDMPGEANADSVQRYMTWNPDNLSSIASSIAAARENARIIREVISAEMWEQLNYHHLWMQSPAARAMYERNRTDFYSRVKRINPLIHGIAEGTMSHGEAWEFFQLGRYLERAGQTARILDVKYYVLLPTPEHVGTPVDIAHWMAILTSCSGYEPYHKQRVATDAQAAVTVAEFLIFDPLFPRSVRYCLRSCQTAAASISVRPAGRRGNEVENSVQSLLGWLQLISIDDFIKAGLHEALTHVIDRIHEIGESIRHTYFDFVVPSATIAPTQSPCGDPATATQASLRATD